MMRTAIVFITVSASVNPSDIAYEYGVRVEDILRENYHNVLLVEQVLTSKSQRNSPRFSD